MRDVTFVSVGSDRRPLGAALASVGEDPDHGDADVDGVHPDARAAEAVGAR